MGIIFGLSPIPKEEDYLKFSTAGQESGCEPQSQEDSAVS